MQQPLRDGLILRSLSAGFASDREKVPDFYSATFAEAGDDDPIGRREWVRTLVSSRHPAMTDDDVWMVVDPAHDDMIVSAVLLIPQTWHYEGIPLEVGRVELVATHKDYRRRGLVRAQMDAAHARSHHLGHHMQAITGIGHYYRQFGYAMAVDLGVRSSLPFYAVPALPENEQPRHTFRLATEADAEQLYAWDQYRARSARLAKIRTPDEWRFEISGRHDAEVWNAQLFIISDQAGDEVGYVMLRLPKEFKYCAVLGYVIGEKSSYLATWGDVTRHIKAFAPEFYQQQNLAHLTPDAIYFDSGSPEVVETILQATGGGRVLASNYAWYLRVEDVGRLLKHLAPALEKRLEGSVAHRYTGTLKIGFYELQGVELTFDQGKLVDAVQRPFVLHEGDVSYPFHSFLNVLFGHRTPVELHYAFPEAWANPTARVLLEVMFPKQRSWVNPLA